MDYPAAKALYQEPLAKTWGNGGVPDVANQAALPAGGNTLGDVCVATDTGTAYVWDGGAWVAKGTYDNTPEWVKEFDFGRDELAGLLSCVIDPVPADGTDGDFFLNTNSMDFFEKAAGAWTKKGDLATIVDEIHDMKVVDDDAHRLTPVRTGIGVVHAPRAGMRVWNKATQSIDVWDGTAWHKVHSSSAAVVDVTKLKAAVAAAGSWADFQTAIAAW